MSEIITNKLTGKTAAGDVTITSEGGSATMQLQQGVAKAWVNFDGTGTIASRDSHNLSSLTDSGTGLYLINYSNDMGNDDYTVSGGARSPGSASGVINAPSDAASDLATGSIEVYAVDMGGTPADRNHIYVIIHGDLA